MQRRSSVAASAGSCIESEASAAKRVGALAISAAIQSLASRAVLISKIGPVRQRTQGGRLDRIDLALRPRRGEREELHLDAGLVHLRDAALDVDHRLAEQIGALDGRIELGLIFRQAGEVERLDDQLSCKSGQMHLFADDLAALRPVSVVRRSRVAFEWRGAVFNDLRPSASNASQRRDTQRGDRTPALRQTQTHHVVLSGSVPCAAAGCTVVRRSLRCELDAWTPGSRHMLKHRPAVGTRRPAIGRFDPFCRCGCARIALNCLCVFGDRLATARVLTFLRCERYLSRVSQSI